VNVPALTIEFDPRPLERIEADVLWICLLEDERPLRGGAGRVDWRLCGQISELVVAERIAGRPGEALLLPGGRTLAAPRVLATGVGPRARYDAGAVRAACADAARRCHALGATRVGCGLPGFPQDAVARYAASLLGGWLEAAREGAAPLEWRVSLSADEAPAAARALQQAVGGEASAGLTIVLPSAAEWASRMSTEPHSGGASPRPRGVRSSRGPRPDSSGPTPP